MQIDPVLASKLIIMLVIVTWSIICLKVDLFLIPMTNLQVSEGTVSKD